MGLSERQQELLGRVKAELTTIEYQRLLQSYDHQTQEDTAKSDGVSQQAVQRSIMNAKTKLAAKGMTVSDMPDETRIREDTPKPCSCCGGDIINGKCVQCGLSFSKQKHFSSAAQQFSEDYVQWKLSTTRTRGREHPCKYKTLTEWARTMLTENNIRAWNARERHMGEDDDLEGGVFKPIDGYQKMRRIGFFDRLVYHSYCQGEDSASLEDSF